MEEENMVNAVVDQVINEIQSSLSPMMKQVRLEAIKFKQEIEQGKKELESFKYILSEQKRIRMLNGGRAPSKGSETGDPDPGYQDYKEYARQRYDFLHGETPKKIYSAMMDFWKILNQALNQEVKTVIVIENEEGNPVLFEAKSEDILKFDTGRGNSLVARYDTTNKTLESSFERLKIIDEDNRNFDNLNDTYKESLSRYNAYKQKSKRIMWKNPEAPPKWRIMKVSTKGDLAEAYSAVVIKRRESDFNGEVEIDLDTFMMNYVHYVDSASGMLQGDIEDGNIQYAIKSVGAGTMGITQFIKLADEIIKDVDFDEGKLQKKKEELAKKGKLRNLLVNGAKTQAEAEAYGKELGLGDYSININLTT